MIFISRKVGVIAENMFFFGHCPISVSHTDNADIETEKKDGKEREKRRHTRERVILRKISWKRIKYVTENNDMLKKWFSSWL